MTYKTHITGGFLLTLTTVPLLTNLNIKPDGLGEVALLFSCAIIGSILPDIDHPNSKINKYNPLSSFICAIVKHRTFTHSLLWMVVVSLIGLLLKVNTWAILGLNIGILSHLILDMLNPTGVPLLYPYKKKFHVCSISTSSAGEWGVLGLMIIAVGYIIIGA